jgi:hypothetical protein
MKIVRLGFTRKASGIKYIYCFQYEHVALYWFVSISVETCFCSIILSLFRLFFCLTFSMKMANFQWVWLLTPNRLEKLQFFPIWQKIIWSGCASNAFFDVFSHLDFIRSGSSCFHWAVKRSKWQNSVFCLIWIPKSIIYRFANTNYLPRASSSVEEFGNVCMDTRCCKL